MPHVSAGRRSSGEDHPGQGPELAAQSGHSAFLAPERVVLSPYPGAPPLALLLSSAASSSGPSGVSEVSVPALSSRRKGDGVSRQLPRLVKNQILFREVNERVRETLGRDEGLLDFVCECGNEDCIDRVTLDVREYERVRSNASLFLIAAGHERLHLERVVD
jgi:hypothetical protein